MRRRTFLLGSVSTAAGGGVLFGTGAFSESESQRTVRVEVAGDDDAYLRLVYDSRDVTCQSTVVLVELTNHLKEEITEINLSYSVSNDEVRITGFETPKSLDAGESGSITVDVECDTKEPSEAIVTFEIEVVTHETDLTVQNRETPISCHCPDETDDTATNNSQEESIDGDEESDDTTDSENGELNETEA